MSAGSLSFFVGVDFIHRLGAAVRFFDIFTGETVRVPLEVSIPSLRWSAFHAESDGTYRFVVTRRDVPSGNFTLEVEIPGREYEGREPMQVSLPRPIGHPPPIVRPDYLVEFPLWPTRRRRTPPGETAIIGRIVSGGPTNVGGLRMFLFEPPGPAPASPYAYSNGDGEFLFRLPQLRAQMSGGVAVTTATLNIEVRHPSNALVAPVTPSSIVADLGRLSSFEFNVP